MLELHHLENNRVMNRSALKTDYKEIAVVRKLCNATVQHNDLQL